MDKDQSAKMSYALLRRLLEGAWDEGDAQRQMQLSAVLDGYMLESIRKENMDAQAV